MIRMIFARSRNGVIGREGAIPWRLRNDMRFFRSTTEGNTVVMGRKTFESIGRPLPNRVNIVLTRDPSFRADGVQVASSPEDAIALAGGDLFVIGGQEVYELFMPWAEEIYVTVVETELDGDTHFFEPTDWPKTELMRHPADGENEYAHTIFRLTRPADAGT